MSRLSSEAEQLVRAGREALRPSDADRERVFQALLPRLGPGAGTEGINAPSPAPAAAKGMVVKISTVLVGLGIAGAGLFLALRTESPPARPAATAPVGPPPAAPAATTPVTSPAVPPARVEPVPASAPSSSPQAGSGEKLAPAAPRPADSLAEEVAILSQASSELHAGRPASALKTLDQHRRRFPRGVLGQERTAARVQALCALGRMKEAQAEIARLARSSPNSPHVARARKACGSGLTEKKE